MDEITLTPNRRLAATLHKLHVQQQQQEKQAWPTPLILPINTWLQTLWQVYSLSSLQPCPHLLNSAQEQVIWEKIIATSPEANHLLQIPATAELVRSSYSLLKQWRVKLDQPIFNSSEDYLALRNWIKRYEAQCLSQNWIDNASLPEILKDKVQLPGVIKLVGFTEITPQVAYFLNGSNAHVITTSSTGDSARVSLADTDEELLTCARWAKQRHLANKDAKIACVIPDLDKSRDRLAQVFSNVFEGEAVYNISAGKPLSHYPAIISAFELLNLYQKRSNDRAFSYLLTSPYVGEAEVERANRCAYEVHMRKRNMSSVDLERLLNSNFTNTCPRLAQRLQRFFDHLSTLSPVQSYEQWASTFSELLTLLGWPGERSLCSEEYQIVSAWLALLTEFNTIDHVAEPTSFFDALSALQKMAAKTIFQPKTPDAPIQILGVLEAAGSPFDYVWMAGMNDVNWPPQPKPNPFIPKVIQREQQMPHATPERELHFCNLLIEQFKSNAKQLIFSFARVVEDLEVKESPLIHVEHELNLIDLNLLDYFSPTKTLFDAKKWESLVDEQGPPLREERVAGGISIIKHQAACPFRAFAEWRLHAHDMETTQPGLRAKDRGNVIHKALEIIWTKLKNQTALLALSETELDELLADGVSEAVTVLPDSHQSYTHYLTLEHQRLKRILKGWLEIEKHRPWFNVLANESKVEYQLGKLTINLRVDRIDELACGRKLIIDYKTGTPNVNAWFDPRLDEPQLPIYALIDPDRTIGICFAQIAAGEHAYKGVSQDDLQVKGIREISALKNAAPSWREQISTWQQHLSSLANDFSNGIATVDPKEEQTCVHCALLPLCRKNEEMSYE